MKKIVLIATIAILVLSGVEVKAQIQHHHPEDDLYKGLLTNEEYFENSDYILEVIYLSNMNDLVLDYYASKIGADVNKEDENGVLKTAIDEDEIYTLWPVKVLHVYKGKNVKEGDTIVAFAKGGYLRISFTSPYFSGIGYTTIGRGSGYRGDHGVSILRDKSSIIFGNNTEFPKSLDKPKNDHYLKMKIQNKYRARLFWEDGKFSGLNDLYFENRYELCKYMAQFEGINVNLNDQKQMLHYLFGDDEARSQYIKEMNIDLKKQNDSSFRFMIQQREELLKSVEKKKSSDGKAGVDLTFWTLNHQQTYSDSKHYYEFDLGVTVNSNNIYLYYFEPWISYNVAAFGQNIRTAGKLTVTNYINAKYGEIYHDDPSNNNTLGISYLYKNNSGDKTPISTGPSPTKILHIKIELQPGLNNVPAQIQFLNNVNYSFYTTAANGTSAIHFDHIYFNNPWLILNNMPPSISSFSPATVRAGLGEVLTINGSKFGYRKGKVIFTSAEGITRTNAGFLKGLDDQYIMDWTDTQIKVKVPSFIADGYNPTDFGYGGSAGTGKIKIVTASDITSAASANPLTIEYSVTNHKKDYNPVTPIERVYLARTSCDYDFWFVLHTNIRDHANKTQIIDAIESALAKWRDSTKLNVRLIKDANGYQYVSSFSNTANVIGFEDVNGFMGTTGRFVSDPGINKFYRGMGSHIRINPNYTWNYSTTQAAPARQLSFYNTMLHELGHILLLGHIYDNGKLMHATENHFASNPIINFSTQASAINGAKRTVQDSRPPNFSWNWTDGGLLILADSISKPVITSNTGFAICNGSTITLTTPALSGASYQWKKDGLNFATTRSITISAAGQYTVEVSKNGCSRTANPVTVTMAPMIGNITTSQTWNTDKTLCQNIAVQPGATLTISATATVFSSNYTITIMNGGKLILSGTIDDGNIIAQNGSELTMTNNGKILIGNYDNLDVQSGAVFNLGYGEVSLKWNQPRISE